MEGEATRLCIYFEVAETEDYEISDTTVEFVEDVFKQYDLYPERIDEYNIHSEYFPDSDVNMTAVDEIEARFEEKFSAENLERYTVARERYGVPPGAYQTWISIKGLPENLEAEAKALSDHEETTENETRKSSSEDNTSVTVDWENRDTYGAPDADSGPEWRAFDSKDEDELSTDSDWGGNLDVNSGAPNGEVIIGIVSEPDRTAHEYYQIDNAAEFFGDSWQDNTAMANKIHESDIEPFKTASLPNADWVIPEY